VECVTKSSDLNIVDSEMVCQSGILAKFKIEDQHSLLALDFAARCYLLENAF